MNSTNLIIIKLGGSSITKKAANKFEMNYDVLNQSAQEILNATKQTKDKIILVCGVGPFGHTNVKKFGLNNGVNSREQLVGVKKTISDCDFVARETSLALKKVGLETKIIPGHEVCKQNNKRVTSFESSEYIKAIKSGVIPITTGTMVKDEILNWSVMSGDTVVAELCKQLTPKRVLMGTDVNGIYSSDPKKNSDAKLFELINKNNLSQILELVGESSAVDVTGGMKGKLEKLARTLGGVEGTIFNLFTKKNLEYALIGKKIRCTKINL